MVYVLVGIAGMIGASLRYLLGVFFNQWWVHGFPAATFTANIAGSFILGWFTVFLPRVKALHPHLVTALGTGLVGSFTTFSTFSIETVRLLKDGAWGTALLYVLLSLWGGLLFSWAGFRLGQAKEEVKSS
ncbi:fluoride efflux transporter CrcB [Bacillus massiliglaciei]|uniref:fluoride efflux transporter CrcB n=1 Tax=Bacillus massiliglaciei TaxID=1816693 RepID=UPI0018FE544E|nr:fluoride efflux transporter CrcB [Bacillus massiliglaciei]